MEILYSSFPLKNLQKWQDFVGRISTKSRHSKVTRFAKYIFTDLYFSNFHFMMGRYTKRSRMNINEAHIKDSKRNYFNLNKKKYHKLCVWSREEHKIFIKRLLTASASQGSATSRLHYAPHYLAPLNNDLLYVTCDKTYTETWQELKCLVVQSKFYYSPWNRRSTLRHIWSKGFFIKRDV